MSVDIVWRSDQRRRHNLPMVAYGFRLLLARAGGALEEKCHLALAPESSAGRAVQLDGGVEQVLRGFIASFMVRRPHQQF